MKTKTTVVRGLAIDVIVVETMHADAAGLLFFTSPKSMSASGRLAPRNLSGGHASPVPDRSLLVPSSEWVSARWITSPRDGTLLTRRNRVTWLTARYLPDLPEQGFNFSLQGFDVIESLRPLRRILETSFSGKDSRLNPLIISIRWIILILLTSMAAFGMIM